MFLVGVALGAVSSSLTVVAARSVVGRSLCEHASKVLALHVTEPRPKHGRERLDFLEPASLVAVDGASALDLVRASDLAETDGRLKAHQHLWHPVGAGLRDVYEDAVPLAVPPDVPFAVEDPSRPGEALPIHVSKGDTCNFGCTSDTP